MDKEIQSQLYDPKKRRSAWLDFVMEHKNIRLPNGRINLKAISKLWKMKSKKSKAYDPQKKYKVSLYSNGILKSTETHKSHLAATRSGENWELLRKGNTFRVYDPHRLIETKEEGGREVPEAHDHYHKNIKIYDPRSNVWRSPNKRWEIRQAENKNWIVEDLKEGYKEVLSGTYPDLRQPYMIPAHVKNQLIKMMTRTSQKLYDPAPVKHGINRPPKRWFYAMLKGIEKRSDVRNPAAIVGSIWKRLSPSKRAEIKRRELQGKPFKYDLPLPDDKATHGTGTLRMVKPFKLVEVQVNLSVKDYLAALKSGLFQRMKRGDGTTALVARCKSAKKNCNIFIDKDVK